MSLLSSIHYQKTIGNYFKVVFSDDSLLIVIPDQQSIQYADKELGQIKTIKDSEIGEKEIIGYNGKTYKLENKHDYQFVVKKIIGGLLDIEGECMFSDYVNQNDSDDCLSLGWISYDGRRADVNSHNLLIEDINIISSI
jgi:carbonic anhydrase